MRTLILCALLGLATAASAQSNRLSIGVNAFSQRDMRLYQSDERYKNLENGVSFLPSIGYYRMTGRSLGVGLELGYGTQRRTDRFISDGAGLFMESRSEVAYREYYVCPTLLESFDFSGGRYKLVTTLSLPVSYIPQITGFTAITQTGPSGTYGSRIIEPDGSMLKLGLFLNAGVQRRLVGGLYAGVQLGAGGSFSHTSVEGARVTMSTTGAPPQYSEQMIDRSEHDLRFELRPMLSLNYYF